MLKTLLAAGATVAIGVLVVGCSPSGNSATNDLPQRRVRPRQIEARQKHPSAASGELSNGAASAGGAAINAIGCECSACLERSSLLPARRRREATFTTKAPRRNRLADAIAKRFIVRDDRAEIIGLAAAAYPPA